MGYVVVLMIKTIEKWFWNSKNNDQIFFQILEFFSSNGNQKIYFLVPKSTKNSYFSKL